MRDPITPSVRARERLYAEVAAFSIPSSQNLFLTYPLKSFFQNGALVFEYNQKAKIFGTPPPPFRTSAEAIDSIAWPLTFLLLGFVTLVGFFSDQARQAEGVALRHCPQGISDRPFAPNGAAHFWDQENKKQKL
jgi:hypothetical protein